MDPSRCVVTAPVGWTVQRNDGNDFRDDGSVLAADNVTYLRNSDCGDSHAELKLVFKQPISAHTLDITCNARFVEIYVQNEALLKYQSTTRGKNTDVPNIFAAQMKEPIDCRELHLRFVSIKPVAGEDGALIEDPVQLRLTKLSLEYRTAGPASTAQSTDTNASSSAMNMMSMMALSMMAPGGGLPGMMPGGIAPPPPPGTTANPIDSRMGPGPGAGGGMAALLGMAVSAMQSGSGGAGGMALGPGAFGTGRLGADGEGSGPTMREIAGSGQLQNRGPAAGPVASQNMATESQGAGGDRPAAVVSTAGSEPSGNQPPSQPASTPTPPAAPAPAPAPPASTTRSASTSAPAPPARPPSGGLDVSQLASILWTVKSSIVSDIDALLDRKLSPVLVKLESLEGQVRQLQRVVEAGGKDASSQPSVELKPSPDIFPASAEEGDTIPDQEHVVD